MLSLIYMIGCIVFVAVLAVVIYYAVYSRVINQRIHDMDAKYKKMPGMPKVIGIIVMVCILVYIIVITSRYKNSLGENRLSEHIRDNFAVINVKNNEYISYFGDAELKDASFIERYSMEENVGYDKQVITDGDFVFTVFTTNTPRDDFHPDFLCYVTYKGENADFMFRQAEFVKPEEDYSSGGSSIGEVEDTSLFIGNLDEGCHFSIKLGVLSEEAEQKYMKADINSDTEPDIEDYAESMGSVIFSIEND